MLSDTERSAVAGIFKKRIALTQLFKYFFVGATAALIDWLFYWILVNYGRILSSGGSDFIYHCYPGELSSLCEMGF